MYTFKKATCDDINALAEIRSEFLMAIENSPTKEMHEKMFLANKAYFEDAIPNDNFVAWIALDGDKIIATSGLSFSVVPPNMSCRDGKVAYIMNMYTIPKYRNQGLASELFKRIMEEALARGFKKITLNATDEGKPVYKKFGFKDVIGDMEKYGNLEQ
ncbi:MAG: GNAT family N-acetyltransferase [Defluviitaleaceae bacterium]|nr:GNAT family N-acetyltransferase [Defluviitaleaceae bacterium]